jgi:hypothetical protein
LGPMYPAQHLLGAEQRLQDFLIGRFGGPHTYIEQRGHPRLRARHQRSALNNVFGRIMRGREHGRRTSYEAIGGRLSFGPIIFKVFSASPSSPVNADA